MSHWNTQPRRGYSEKANLQGNNQITFWHQTRRRCGRGHQKDTDKHLWESTDQGHHLAPLERTGRRHYGGGYVENMTLPKRKFYVLVTKSSEYIYPYLYLTKAKAKKQFNILSAEFAPMEPNYKVKRAWLEIED